VEKQQISMLLIWFDMTGTQTNEVLHTREIFSFKLTEPHLSDVMIRVLASNEVDLGIASNVVNLCLPQAGTTYILFQTDK
jgi:hypothetical protein